MFPQECSCSSLIAIRSCLELRAAAGASQSNLANCFQNIFHSQYEVDFLHKRIEVICFKCFVFNVVYLGGVFGDYFEGWWRRRRVPKETPPVDLFAPFSQLERKTSLDGSPFMGSKIFADMRPMYVAPGLKLFSWWSAKNYFSTVNKMNNFAIVRGI